MIHHDIMAPLMFGGLIVFLLIGYPAAFSLGAVGLFFSVIGICVLTKKLNRKNMSPKINSSINITKTIK